MDVRTWRSGRTSASGFVLVGYGRRRSPPGPEALLRGKTTPLGDQEAVSGDAQAGMMVKATPAAPFEVAQPDLLLELTIVALDAPAAFRGGDQLADRGVGRHGGQPVLGGLRRPVRPLGQQPFFRVRLTAPIIPVGWADVWWRNVVGT